jgi:hypothetical protein
MNVPKLPIEIKLEAHAAAYRATTSRAVRLDILRRARLDTVAATLDLDLRGELYMDFGRLLDAAAPLEV